MAKSEQRYEGHGCVKVLNGGVRTKKASGRKNEEESMSNLSVLV